MELKEETLDKNKSGFIRTILSKQDNGLIKDFINSGLITITERELLVHICNLNLRIENQDNTINCLRATIDGLKREV